MSLNNEPLAGYQEQHMNYKTIAPLIFEPSSGHLEAQPNL